MSELSRRLFLKRGSLTVAAAGIMSALPGMPSLVGALSSDGPAAGADASEAASAASSETGAAGSLAGPLVAQVKDLSTGEISVFMGENEYTYHDPQMAAKLLQATR